LPALESYEAGEKIAQAAADTELGWQLAYGRGQAREALGRNAEAVAAYRQAVEIVEGVRSQLREERFRAGYLEDKSRVYVALIHLLLKMGKAFRTISSAAGSKRCGKRPLSSLESTAP
jgi:tetratricopeptide (TPR) repeat protein